MRLLSVTVQSGEKLLVLKKKFRSDAPPADFSMASTASPKALHRPKKQKLQDSFPLSPPSPEEEEAPAAPKEAEMEESPDQALSDTATLEDTGLSEATGGDEGSTLFEMDSTAGSSLLSEIQNQMTQLVEKADEPVEEPARPESPVEPQDVQMEEKQQEETPEVAGTVEPLSSSNSALEPAVIPEADEPEGGLGKIVEESPITPEAVPPTEASRTDRDVTPEAQKVRSNDQNYNQF